MKKIFQTIVDRGSGNCMQAAIASLFDMELDEVPNFIEFNENAGFEVMKFVHSLGYEYCNILRDTPGNGTEMLKKVAKFDGGVNGFFYASVNSQTFEGVSHAVIVNKDLEIVHDPNPNQKAMKLTPSDVTMIMPITDFIISKTGELISKDKWDSMNEEEIDKHIWKIGEKR